MPKSAFYATWAPPEFRVIVIWATRIPFRVQTSFFHLFSIDVSISLSHFLFSWSKQRNAGNNRDSEKQSGFITCIAVHCDPKTSSLHQLITSQGAQAK